MAKEVLVFAEQRGGALRKVSFEMVSTGRKLADAMGGECAAVVCGDGVEGVAAELGKYGADKVYVVSDAKLKDYVPDLYSQAVAEVAKDAKVVIGGASAMGKDLFPRVAARLDTALASDCTKLEMDGDSLVSFRPVFAGKAYITMKVTSSPQMALGRPKVFPAEENAKAGSVENVSVSLGDAKAVLKELSQETGGRVDLTEADVIVSGGRGMKGPDEYKILEELADAIGPAATVGASRASVDAGWRPHADQVGQTGKTVSPSLYIACGISGAIQHLAGMGSSKYIVAINKDPDAPIFAKADYGIADDLFKVVPEVTKEVKKLLAE
jgi:electron transfer flavoprotein alpha subunit